MKFIDKEKAAVSVTIGPKGQIVIPKQIREMFNINVGDTMFIVAQKNEGIAIIKEEQFLEQINPIISKLGGNKNNE